MLNPTHSLTHIMFVNIVVDDAIDKRVHVNSFKCPNNLCNKLPVI